MRAANGARADPRRPRKEAAARASAGTDEGIPEVGVDCRLRDPEGAADPDGLQLAGVDETIHGHLRHAHNRSHFRDGKKSDVAKGSCIRSHPCPTSARSRARLTGFGAPVTYVSRVSRARKRAGDETSRSRRVPGAPGLWRRRSRRPRGVSRSWWDQWCALIIICFKRLG